jgi:hypothetical protein
MPMTSAILFCCAQVANRRNLPQLEALYKERRNSFPVNAGVVQCVTPDSCLRLLRYDGWPLLK